MTVQTLVNRALRHMGNTDGPVNAPPAEDAMVGLESLQKMLKQGMARGWFGPITDVYTTENYTAGENERVTRSASQTITIPTTITDAWTGDTRAPEDRAFVIVAGLSYNLYDANQAAWIVPDSLTLASAEPLEPFDISALLALHMSGEFGHDLMPTVAQDAARVRAALKIKKPTRVTAPVPVLLMHASRGRVAGLA